MTLNNLKCFGFLFLLSLPGLGFAQTIYSRDRHTNLADSLHTQGAYEEAIVNREEAIRATSGATEDYKKYVHAKLWHTRACLYEFKSYKYHNPNDSITKIERERLLILALKTARKARSIYQNANPSDKFFQYNLQNRIYHQTAYLGNWDNALQEARMGYQILKDTLGERDIKFVDLIYDIGYIYSQLGDYSKAVLHYQKSLDLYRNLMGENNTAVAQAYHNISKEYRNLGLRKKEYESLIRAKQIWENLKDETDTHFLYHCYGNLYQWYAYYGDFTNADYYLLKRNKLYLKESMEQKSFLRNSEERYEGKLGQWHDLMLYTLKKEDSSGAKIYMEKILSSIKNSKKAYYKFEIDLKSSALRHKAELLRKSDPEIALESIDQAIELLELNSEIFYTNSFPNKVYKVELLFQQKKFAEVTKLLQDLIPEAERAHSSELFSLYILQGKTEKALGNLAKAEQYFNKALAGSLEKKFFIDKKVAFKDLKPIVSFETIEGFIDMGDFYMDLFSQNYDSVYLDRAFDRYQLSSMVFYHMYLGEQYNNQLYRISSKINDRLLKCGLLDIQKKPEKVIAILNMIENNGSKLTWSKFRFNNKRENINLPEDLINREEELKAELNFYNRKLYNSPRSEKEKQVLWLQQVDSLKYALSDIQDNLKLHYNTYYQFTTQIFDAVPLQKALKKDEIVLRYVNGEKDLYRFELRNNIAKLTVLGKTSELNNDLTKHIESLTKRQRLTAQGTLSLQQKLMSGISVKESDHLLIIPDAKLSYLPFETIFKPERMPALSYSSSLLLFSEQRKTARRPKQMQLAAFANSISKDKKLNARLGTIPNSVKEINELLKLLNGEKFINASKKVFLDNVNDFDILHLATHALIDEKNPEFSSLNFYDDQLLISELYNESISANMVVLSACETGSGIFEKGEGVISLSRAFTYAGVPSTVLSLWKVDDDATSILMKYFYKFLNEGDSKHVALKKAKLEYLKNTDDELLSHPYYWAGFVLNGNTDAIVSDRQSQKLFVLSAFIILIIILGIKKSGQFFK